jgi:hypothetical protein
VSGIVVPIPNPVRILGIDETSVLFLILILGCDLRYAGKRRARVLKRKQGRRESTRALLVSVRSSPQRTVLAETLGRVTLNGTRVKGRVKHAAAETLGKGSPRLISGLLLSHVQSSAYPYLPCRQYALIPGSTPSHLLQCAALVPRCPTLPLHPPLPAPPHTSV